MSKSSLKQNIRFNQIQSKEDLEVKREELKLKSEKIKREKSNA